MADAEEEEISSVRVSITLPPAKRELLVRYEEVVLKSRTRKGNKRRREVTLGGLVLTAMEASIETFEQYVPAGKPFVLNGCRIERE